jgi:1-pyrroline-5-carboxylate dehydrogenase
MPRITDSSKPGLVAATTDLPRVTYSNITQDFSSVHARLDEAIPQFQASRLGKPLRNRANGADLPIEDEYAVTSPIDDRVVLAVSSRASRATVDAAVSAASRARAAWCGMPWHTRVTILERVADALARHKWDLAIASLLEVGKSRMEAMGEVEETIDLVRYYCVQMREHDGFRAPLRRAFAGESTEVVLRPHGVFGVIAPFNYPVALSVSMITGALLGGNTVVFKPSPNAGLTARMLVDVYEEAGVPPGAVNIVCGGAATGHALATHAQVDGLVFTGSHQVGMQLLRERAMGPHAKPVIAEMGGKNPAYVCESANLADAVEGVARSAYGLQGEKCSCESRVFVHAAIFDAFIERLIARTARMKRAGEQP